MDDEDFINISSLENKCELLQGITYYQRIRSDMGAEMYRKYNAVAVVTEAIEHD